MSTKRKLLVYGYVRKAYNNDVPDALINLFLLFFNDEFVWTFTEHTFITLQDLLSMQHQQCLKSKPIKYNNDISIQYELYPNGRKFEYKGFVQFYLFIKRMDKSVHYVTIGFCLYCDQTKTVFNTLSRYYQSNLGNGWMNQLSLSKCKKLKKLTFRCSINSLQINYKRKYTKTMFNYLSYKPFFKRNMNFKWHLNKSLLKQFLKCQDGQRFCSPQFNNWSFDIAVFEDELKIYLVLIRYPSSVTKIKVKCIVTEQINQNNEISQEYIHCFDIAESTNGLYIDCDKNRIPTFLLTDNSFDLSVNIKILEMFDDRDHFIPINQWNDHDFDIGHLKQTDIPCKNAMHCMYIMKASKTQYECMHCNKYIKRNKKMLICVQNCDYDLCIECGTTICDDDEEEEEDEEKEDNNKTLTGIWDVYYTWDNIGDTDMTKLRYAMELKQDEGGNIDGKCIEGSGCSAWSFVLTGKLEKGNLFRYTMHGEIEEIFCEATFDGNNIIKNGMWSRDKLCLIKGGNLMAIRKDIELPNITNNTKETKRKRDCDDTTNNNDSLYIPPSKKQKISNLCDISCINLDVVSIVNSIDMLEQLRSKHNNDENRNIDFNPFSSTIQLIEPQHSVNFKSMPQFLPFVNNTECT